MTYDELRAALHAYMARTDPEAVGNEGTALELARVKLNRGFHPEGAMAMVLNVAMVDGQGTLPADFGQAEAVSTAGGDLEYATPREFVRMAGRGSTAGQFTVAGSRISADPAVDHLSVLYYRTADAIAGAATNWLSFAYADVWMWTAVAEQHRFVQDWESAMAADSYAEGLARAAEVQSRGNKAGGALRMVTRR